MWLVVRDKKPNGNRKILLKDKEHVDKIGWLLCRALACGGLCAAEQTETEHFFREKRNMLTRRLRVVCDKKTKKSTSFERKEAR